MSEQDAEKIARQALRERLYVALVEQRVIDSQHFGEAPYAPITWEDVDRVIPLATSTPHPADSDARALQDTQAEAGETGGRDE